MAHIRFYEDYAKFSSSETQWCLSCLDVVMLWIFHLMFELWVSEFAGLVYALRGLWGFCSIFGWWIELCLQRKIWRQEFLLIDLSFGFFFVSISISARLYFISVYFKWLNILILQNCNFWPKSRLHLLKCRLANFKYNLQRIIKFCHKIFLRLSKLL